MLRVVTALGVVGLAAAGCGGPPIGSKIPQADPATVAVGAAAAATALTLANPSRDASKKEKDPGRAMRGVRAPREPMPEGVLDRSEASSEPPCEERTETDATTPPPAIDMTAGQDPDPDRIATPPPPQKRCKERGEGETK